MEMNTRLQVEHPISELITGIDIVKEQIKIAMGQPLALNQQDIYFTGVAIECRLNAEDSNYDFRASSGQIDRLILPAGPHVRIESGIYSDYFLPPYYDSMVAKIISYGHDLNDAMLIMERALSEVVVEGITTNVDLLQALIMNDEVQTLNFHTKWLEENFLPQWLKREEDVDETI